MSTAKREDVKDPDLIMQWDLEEVKHRMIQREGFDPEKVERMEREYRRYMYLLVTQSDDEVTPIPEAIDDMWHWHVLLTRDYTEFCEAVKGEYIHHHPFLQKHYFNTTLPRYEEEFGEEPPTEFWGDQKAICWDNNVRAICWDNNVRAICWDNDIAAAK